MNRCVSFTRILKLKSEIRLRRNVILGIETSCDDTGAAVLDLSGKLLGESIATQKTPRFGGVIPTISMLMHKDKIQNVVSEALLQAEKSMDDVTAVAVTNRPGMKGSLIVGTDYAKYLCKKFHKPLIPVHHMIAHALTVRMEEEVEFPFMFLLISGGHCLLGVAKDVNDFDILGTSINDSPGEALDKIARMLKVHSLPGLRDINGGPAIEMLARKGDPHKIEIGIPLRHERNCHFSFAGFKGNVDNLLYKIRKETGKNDLSEEMIADMSAAVQYSLTKHLCERLQRAITYIQMKEIIENSGTLVVSGGVASNMFIRGCIEKVCTEMGWRAVFPRPKLCTDNGIMIGWTGLELWRRGHDILHPDEALQLDVYSRCPMGRDVSQDVIDTGLKCKWIKIT